MNNPIAPPKPIDPEQPSGKGLDGTPCSPLPCPFCDSDEIYWSECGDFITNPSGGDYTRLVCLRCGSGTTTYPKSSMHKCLTLWNSRQKQKASITQRQIEDILTHEGIVSYDAIEQPEHYDGGKTELAVMMVTRAINAIILENSKLS